MSDKEFKTIDQQLSILENRGLLIPDKAAVAQTFGLNAKGSENLEKFMHHMTIIRNLCAHGSRLYNRLFEQKPKLNKKELAMLITRADGTPDNAHLYGFILIMRRLLKPSDFTALKQELCTLSDAYPFVHLKYYGFRSDWKTIL